METAIDQHHRKVKGLRVIHNDSYSDSTNTNSQHPSFMAASNHRPILNKTST
ncbi:hypothetical protein TWF730_000615 [Orbilia blumenaviensis]|uniref:Uncharacterized protein n=1 Tax=Orbilia blumenaviensis TaxID=1796055 RepID=A0AAV9VM44_9PEZI